MENKSNSKSFLMPIVLLSIFSIVLVASILTYINIQSSKEHLQKDIRKKTEEYLNQKVKFIQTEVQRRDRVIRFNNTQVISKLKKVLAQRVQLAHKIATDIYTQNKGKLSDKEIKRRIINHLKIIEYNKGRVFYFISHRTENTILHHKIPKFIGKDMTNFKDKRGTRLIPLRNKAVGTKGGEVGFFQVYFNKPNDTKNQYLKQNAAILFKPYNIIIGMGEYLDVVEKETKKHILEKFKNENRHFKDNEFISVLGLKDINGGDKFASLLINSDNTTIEGSYLSDNLKDINNSFYFKDMLGQIKRNGYAHIKYSLKDNDGIVKNYYEYFLYQKDWDWIISSRFSFNELESSIKEMKQNMIKQNEKLIEKSILYSLTISIFIILIALMISFNINKLIRQYINKINKNHTQIEEQNQVISQQSKMVAMGEMIGNISHQWRQPLSVISTAATGLKLEKEYGTLTDERFIKTCEAIDDNAQYLSQTIDDFKNFIKGDRKKVEFNISKNINSFLHLVDGTIKSYDLNVIIDIEDSLTINSYPNELIQCYLNIFNNAKDALENTDDPKLLFISANQNDEYIQIIFKDNANGIPEDIIDRIFEPYFTTKHKSQGTGLGLHMTYNLIHKGLNGTISVNNSKYIYEEKEYTGAEFIIEVPKDL